MEYLNKKKNKQLHITQRVAKKGVILQDNREHKTIQRKPNNTGLPDNLKSGIEHLSGHSMDDVKVHYNSNKPAQLNAHAYAQGTNIHLASGQEKHLPHEAWHVVQQKQGRVQPTTSLNGTNINDNAGLEKEADVMGSKAIQMKINNSFSDEKKAQGVNEPVVQKVTKPTAAVLGGVLGGAIGMVGGPVGAGIGAWAGAGIGAIAGIGVGALLGGNAPNQQNNVNQGNQNAQQNQQQVPPVQQPIVPAPAPAPVNLRPQINADMQQVTNVRVQIRALLPNGFWGYQHNESHIQDQIDTMNGYLNHNNVNVIQNDQMALQRANQLRLDSAATLQWLQQNHTKVSFIVELYNSYAPLPAGIPTLQHVWQSVLGANRPNNNQFQQYNTTIKQVFTTHAKTGFNGAANKDVRFIHLMKMGGISVGTKGKGKGIHGIYESEFDARKGAFGAEWEVNGLDGWVLHGHGRIHEDHRSFDLNRMHIKRSDQAMALGVSTVIDNDDVRNSVINSSKGHLSKMAKNKYYKHIFDINKSKIRENRGTIY
ncbi:eCIS core domain-containing protein [Tenacibaculum xiamenense]|uniref:eCIS core domain-containing protein n=1 Tax=Tenacibaculum xiamenense TaxID=1261553 RepID=UPI0038943BCC